MKLLTQILSGVPEFPRPAGSSRLGGLSGGGVRPVRRPPSPLCRRDLPAADGPPGGAAVRRRGGGRPALAEDV